MESGAPHDVDRLHAFPTATCATLLTSFRALTGRNLRFRWRSCFAVSADGFATILTIHSRGKTELLHSPRVFSQLLTPELLSFRISRLHTLELVFWSAFPRCDRALKHFHLQNYAFYLELLSFRISPLAQIEADVLASLSWV